MINMKLVYSEEFYNDFQNVIEYIKLDNPKAARNFAEKVINRIKQLKKHPEMGRQVDDPRLEGIRLLVVGNYLVLYEVKTGENAIYLHGFCHGARDYPNVFRSAQ
jgi:addiction module RelE/StbE family toxin